jgi:hypothetical protein
MKVYDISPGNVRLEVGLKVDGPPPTLQVDVCGWHRARGSTRVCLSRAFSVGFMVLRVYGFTRVYLHGFMGLF